jgi:predicted nucleotidyltransferase component of viral defense system
MKDFAASVRAQLLQVARAQKIDFQVIIVRYFQERLLFRLSRSVFMENFCLKGGALIYAIQQDKIRPTLDIDFSGR